MNRNNSNHRRAPLSVDGRTTDVSAVREDRTADTAVARPSLAAARRGFSLMMVMVAISLSVVLTLALLRTQTTNLLIRHNTSRRDLARQAAHTGAAVAMQKIQAVDWSGVATPLSGIVQADEIGTVTYTVQFLELDEARMQPLPEDSALYLVLVSTGRWQSAENAADVVERQVEVVVKLQPRLAGRTVYPGDLAAASDLAPNPGSYDTIQQYALFAQEGASSLVLDPGGRIAGKIWLKDNLKLYEDPQWNAEVRAEMLDGIGLKFFSENGLLHPHPLAGDITFYDTPSSGVQTDLQRLQIPWTQTSQRLYSPAVNFAHWTTYQLYEGGPTYSAVAVGSSLWNVTLRPTPENPLGVFYRNGKLSLGDNVTIQGTLVATDQITITGENVRLCAYNWRGEGGTVLVLNIANWPRLPAIVARKVFVDRNIRTAIEGAVIVQQSFNGAGGDFQYISATAVDLNGTATAAPLRQPYSVVQLQQDVSLTTINDRGDYEIWLDNGTTGNWYTIVDVNAEKRELKVLGEVRHDLPVGFRIRRGRLRFIDIRGPLTGVKFDMNCPPSWATPTNSQWSDLRNLWQTHDKISPILFVDWLSDSTHFSNEDWPYPLWEYGLPLEPTFHLQNTTGIHYRFSPPLFRAYPGSLNSNEMKYAGYRWDVISWREVP